MGEKIPFYNTFDGMLQIGAMPLLPEFLDVTFSIGTVGSETTNDFPKTLSHCKGFQCCTVALDPSDNLNKDFSSSHPLSKTPHNQFQYLK